MITFLKEQLAGMAIGVIISGCVMLLAYLFL